MNKIEQRLINITSKNTAKGRLYRTYLNKCKDHDTWLYLVEKSKSSALSFADVENFSKIEKTGSLCA